MNIKQFMCKQYFGNTKTIYHCFQFKVFLNFGNLLEDYNLRLILQLGDQIDSVDFDFNRSFSKTNQFVQI